MPACMKRRKSNQKRKKGEEITHPFPYRNDLLVVLIGFVVVVAVGLLAIIQVSNPRPGKVLSDTDEQCYYDPCAQFGSWCTSAVVPVSCTDSNCQEGPCQASSGSANLEPTVTLVGTPQPTAEVIIVTPPPAPIATSTLKPTARVTAAPSATPAPTVNVDKQRVEDTETEEERSLQIQDRLDMRSSDVVDVEKADVSEEMGPSVPEQILAVGTGAWQLVVRFVTFLRTWPGFIGG